jgi:PAS domain S-box-containing protein
MGFSVPADHPEECFDMGAEKRKETPVRRQAKTRPPSSSSRKSPHRQVEEERQVSEDRCRRLFETLPDGIIIVDADTEKIVDVNLFLTDRLGYGRDAFIGLKPAETVPFRETTIGREGCKEVKEKGYARYGDVPLVTRDGRTIHVEVTGCLYPADGKRIIQFHLRDITSYKKLETQWSRSVFIVDSAAELMTLINRDYIYAFANDSYCRALGRPREDVIGQSVGEIWGEEKFHWIVKPNIDRCLAGSRIVDESWIDFPAAGRRYFSINYYPYSESGAANTHVVVVSHDITKLKQDAESLQLSYDRLRFAQKASRCGIWDWDMVTGEMTWSDELRELVGLPPSVAPSFAVWRDLMYADDREAAVAYVRSAIDEKKPLSTRFRIMCPDGRVLWIEALGRTEYDNNDQPLRMSGICIDITEHRQTEEDLRRLEDRYRSIVLNAMEGIYQSMPGGRFLSVNPAMAKIFGYDSPEDMMACVTNAREQLYADPECRERFRRLIEAKGRVENFEAEMIRKDGSTTWVSFSTRLVRDQAGRPLYYEGIMEDISQRKMAADDLRRTSDKLRSLASYLQDVREQERTQIARELHDEFGQIMTGIKIDLSRLDDVLQSFAGLPQEVRQRLESLFELTDTAIQTTREIAANLRPSILDDFGILSALSWQARMFEDRTGIACRVSAGPDDLSFSPEISTALFRIGQECLTNVARHSGAREVEIVLDRRGDAAYLSVKDNGRGMKEEDAGAAGSFGILGMRERVSMLGGEIAFHSAPGEGTEVEVMIPIEEQEF